MAIKWFWVLARNFRPTIAGVDKQYSPNPFSFHASDGISTAFQFEVKMDHLVLVTSDTEARASGAIDVTRTIHALSEGLYFPIPTELVSVLVPQGEEEVRIEVTAGDWIDMTTSQALRMQDDEEAAA